MIQRAISFVKESLPLINKYSVIWSVLGDTGKTRGEFTSFLTNEKYSVVKCVQFSIECLALFPIFAVLLRWFGALLSDNSSLEIIALFDPIFSYNALKSELYLAAYFLSAFVVGFFVHKFLMLFSRSGKQEPLAFIRFLVIYPGMALWVVMSTLPIIMIANWISRQMGITLHTINSDELGWFGFILGIPLIGIAVLFWAMLIGVFINFPLMCLWLAKDNYGKGGVVGLALLILVCFLASPIYYRIWIYTCDSSDPNTSLIESAECKVQRVKLGLED